MLSMKSAPSLKDNRFSGLGQTFACRLFIASAIVGFSRPIVASNFSCIIVVHMNPRIEYAVVDKALSGRWFTRLGLSDYKLPLREKQHGILVGDMTSHHLDVELHFGR